MADRKMVRVLCLATGFDNLMMREPGDEFEMPEGVEAPWFKVIDQKQKYTPPAAPANAKDTIAGLVGVTLNELQTILDDENSLPAPRKSVIDACEAAIKKETALAVGHKEGYPSLEIGENLV